MLVDPRSCLDMDTAFHRDSRVASRIRGGALRSRTHSYPTCKHQPIHQVHVPTAMIMFVAYLTCFVERNHHWILLHHCFCCKSVPGSSPRFDLMPMNGRLRTYFTNLDDSLGTRNSGHLGGVNCCCMLRGRDGDSDPFMIFAHFVVAQQATAAHMPLDPTAL